MAERLRFHAMVAEDLREAIRWYDEISVDLGNRFRAEVNARFDDISRRPASFGYAFDRVRFARLRRFPHLLLFRETDDAIYVLGVFHGSRDPARWQRRAEEP